MLRAIIRCAIAGALLIVCIRGAAWLNDKTVDRNGSQETVAVNYTRAVLTHDYSTWWDSVSPTCRVAPNTVNKAEWMAETKRLEAQADSSAVPVHILVAAVTTTGSGDTRSVEVRVKNQWTNLSEYLDVTVRVTNGQWGVTNQAAHGLGPSLDCDVWPRPDRVTPF
jgi:hypothetical protein